MPRYELTLRVDAPGDERSFFDDSPSARARERIYAALRLKVFSSAWVHLSLGTSKADQAMAMLVQERQANSALVGTAHLAEILAEEEEPGSDWSLLYTPQVSGSFSLWDDYPEYKPGSLPKNVHALNHTFVSADFRAVCERASLTGLEFLRLRNAGRKAGAPWFAALPRHCLGNGLDHPWFDRSRWVPHVKHYARKRFGAIETGQSQFHQYWLREAEVRSNALVQRLLEVCPMPNKAESGLFGLRFVMTPRYLAGAQPDEDFAYVPWGEDGPNREGKMMRFRMLALRRRARDALVAAGLFKPRAFKRVLSVAAPEAGVVNLDALHPPVPPMYTAAELAALRAQEPAS